MQVTHFTVGEKGLGPSSGEKQEDRKDSLSRRSEPSPPSFRREKEVRERKKKMQRQWQEERGNKEVEEGTAALSGCFYS